MADHEEPVETSKGKLGEHSPYDTSADALRAGLPTGRHVQVTHVTENNPYFEPETEKDGTN